MSYIDEAQVGIVFEGLCHKQRILDLLRDFITEIHAKEAFR